MCSKQLPGLVRDTSGHRLCFVLSQDWIPKAPAPDLELPLFLFQVYPHPHGLKPNSSSSAGAHAASPCSSHILGWKAEGFPHRSRLGGVCFPAALPMSKPILCPCCSAGCWMVQLGKQEQGISPLMAVRDPGAVPTPGGTPCPFPAALSHCLSLEQQNSPAPHSVPSPRSSSPVPGTSFPILALPPGSRSQKRPNPTCTGWEGQEGQEKAGIGVLAAAAAPWTVGCS